ncbi:MAG: DUF58 domain-containing protein [Eubacterium sp.]|nr:DUF58 domain-containing protein [Eubacterium sp.]
MKAGKTNKRIHLRPFRIAGYVFWLTAMVVMYLMFRSFLLLFFTAFLCIVPLLSVVSGVLLARNITCEITMYQTDTIRPGDEVFPTVEVRNSTWIGALDVRVSLLIYNTFFAESSAATELMVSLPAVSRTLKNNVGVSNLRMPLTVTRIGNYRICIREAQVQDWFGLVRISVAPGRAIRDKRKLGNKKHENKKNQRDREWNMFGKETEFVVLPGMEETTRPDPESISSGMTEVEESNRRGNDFSEVTDLREYVPGDRIRDIHWKASARREDWMVKVRTQMAGMELNAVLMLDVDEHVTENIVRNTYKELRGWVQGENDIHLRVYSALTYGFDSYVLSAPTDVDKAFEEIFKANYMTRLPEDRTAAGLDSILKNRYPYMGGYIRFGLQPAGGIGWEPVEGTRV